MSEDSKSLRLDPLFSRVRVHNIGRICPQKKGVSLVALAAPEAIVGPVEVVQDPYHSKTLIEPVEQGDQERRFFIAVIQF